MKTGPDFRPAPSSELVERVVIDMEVEGLFMYSGMLSSLLV